MATDAFDSIARELRRLVAEHGRALLGDRRRLLGFLLDHHPDHRREVRALAIALDEGVASALAGTERSLAGLTIDRQAARLESEAALRGDVASGVTRALAHALDLGPEPGAYSQGPVPQLERSSPTPPPTPTPSNRPSTSSPPSWWTSRRQGAAIVGGALAVAAAMLVTPFVTGRSRSENAQAVYAQELADFGVPASDAIHDQVGAPTPLQIAGARRVTTADVDALRTGGDEVLLIDVLNGPHDTTIEGAHYLPRAGNPGRLGDAMEMMLDASLRRLTRGRTDVPTIFFCAGARCWESYNAALRAHSAGFSRVLWYRGGLASWTEARLPLAKTPASEEEQGAMAMPR